MARRSRKAETSSVDLGRAIQRALAGRATQAQVAAALGVKQPTVSGWINGLGRPSFEQLAALEDRCDRPRGWVLRAVGLVVDPTDVRSALLADSRLDDVGREIILQLYEVRVETVEQRRR